MIDPFGNRMMSFLLFCRHMGLVFTISETWKEKETVNEVWKLSLLSGKKSDYLEPVSCLHVVWRLSQEENDWNFRIFHFFLCFHMGLEGVLNWKKTPIFFVDAKQSPIAHGFRKCKF